MNRIRLSILALGLPWVVTVLVSFVAGATPALAADGACPNEAIREQQGVAAEALSECRAYEMVSPWGSIPEYYIETRPAGSEAFPGWTLSSVEGGAVVYTSLYGDSASGGSGEMFLSRRGANGWSTEEMIPPQSASRSTEFGRCQPAVFFSANLSESVLSDGYLGNDPPEDPTVPCEMDEPALIEGEPSAGSRNLFLRGEEPGSYKLLDLTPPNVVPANAIFQDASSEFTHIVFGEEAKLTPEAASGNDLYEWTTGALHLVTVLPNGTATSGAMVNGQGLRLVQEGPLLNGYQEGTATFTHGMSANGERVFFTAGGDLYARVNASEVQSRIASGADHTKVNGEQCLEPQEACTIQLDASEIGGVAGGGVFLDAAADGSRVFFMDENKLTAESTAVSGKPDLYEYDLEKPAGERLSDLTVDPHEPADVLGYSGASEDGAYFYFVAEGKLTEEKNSEEAEAVAGQPNLYVDHDGTRSFIATLNPGTDGFDWAGGSRTEGARLLESESSPSGLFMAFNSTESLTKYDNSPAEAKDCEGACAEIYLYDASEGKLRCVSCDPGHAPVSVTGLEPVVAYYSPLEPLIQRRQVLDDGRVYFDSADPLVEADTNGVYDVYEYDEGTLHLISPGTSSDSAIFDEASPNGQNVFFITAQSLVGADTDESASLYDARVDGGFSASVEGPPPAPECTSIGACRTPLGEPPAEPFAASTALQAGTGNLVSVALAKQPAEKKMVGKPKVKRCKKGRVVAHGRCVKQPNKSSKRSGKKGKS